MYVTCVLMCAVRQTHRVFQVRSVGEEPLPALYSDGDGDLFEVLDRQLADGVEEGTDHAWGRREE